MKLAFCLFKYFPFGGLQRDFLRIAEECLRRGHTIHVYTMAWEGEQLPGLPVTIIPIHELTNHRRCLTFSAKLNDQLKKTNYDLIVGFNKIAGLDVYYAADPCYVAKVQTQHNPWYHLTPRYRAYAQLEEAVFNAKASTDILLIAEREQLVLQQFYGTPAERLHVLPPGIARDRCAPANAAQIRADLRHEFTIADDEQLILMVGSGFKTKGVDRALTAVAALPEDQRAKTYLYIIGQDNPRIFNEQAKKLNIETQVKFLGGRNDVPRFLLGADLLLHPAYYENTGTVLLEALVAGLPVLTTDICGYANYIERAGAGIVLASPFLQSELNQQLSWMLTADKSKWQQNALAYAAHNDLYSLPECAVNLLEKFLQKKTSSEKPAAPLMPFKAAPEKHLFKPAIVSQEIVLPERAPQLYTTATEVSVIEQTATGIVPKIRTDTLPVLKQLPYNFVKINRGFTQNTNLPWFKSCLELNEDLKKFWQSEDIFTTIFNQQGQIYRQQKNRKTLLFVTPEKSYFIKLHLGVGWREIFKNIMRGRLPVLGAHPEWRAMLQLNELGIYTARLAGFSSKGVNPAKVNSFVVMEELHNTLSLEDFCRPWSKTPPNPRLKWTLIKEVARIARVLHNNHICHRDFYLCHFLLDITNGVEKLNANFIRLYLLDLHRVYQAPVYLAKRWIIKDLAGLYFSSLEIGLTRRDILRFIKYYRRLPLRGILKQEQNFWQSVFLRANKLYRKEKLALITQDKLEFPMNFALANGSFLMVEQPLRIVPDKRWVVLAQWPHQQVVAKIFYNARHAQRELVGYQALEAAGISTPKLLFHGWIAGEQLYVLLFAYIYPAQSYAELLAEEPDKAADYLEQLIIITAQMHRAGLQQTDLHLKNFLLQEGITYALDPASVEFAANKQALSEPAGLKNLGLLLAQLTTLADTTIEQAYALYTRNGNSIYTRTGLVKLTRWINAWRRYRLRKYKAKVLRSTTQLICRRDWWSYTLCDRQYDSKAMQVFLRNPDAVINSTFTRILKNGNTCTVGLINIEGQQFVVKRYNIKNFWHGLKRAVTPSRAAKSWCNAHLLRLLELPTPKPIAMLERRCGPLRHTAYFISEYVEGIKLTEYFNNKLAPEEAQTVAANIKALLHELKEVRISHGDLKATNILLADNKPILLDLDAMRLHRFKGTAHRASKRDWQRFLRNWAGRTKVLKIFAD